MEMTTYRLPRLSRVKAMIGAALATLAIAGAVQAAAPEPASAMRSARCSNLLDAVEFYRWAGAYEVADALFVHYAITCEGAL